MKKTVIVGCGDMGVQVYNILKHDNTIEIIGFVIEKIRHIESSLALTSDLPKKSLKMFLLQQKFY